MHAAEQDVAKTRPVDDHERMTTIDITRGAALFGVLLMNIDTGFRMPLAQSASTFHTEPGWLNHAVDWFLEIVVAGKAFSAFSLLFGVGLAVQAQRARVAGRSKVARARVRVLR